MKLVPLAPNTCTMTKDMKYLAIIIGSVLCCPGFFFAILSIIDSYQTAQRLQAGAHALAEKKHDSVERQRGDGNKNVKNQKRRRRVRACDNARNAL